MQAKAKIVTSFGSMRTYFVDVYDMAPMSNGVQAVFDTGICPHNVACSWWHSCMMFDVFIPEQYSSSKGVYTFTVGSLQLHYVMSCKHQIKNPF